MFNRVLPFLTAAVFAITPSCTFKKTAEEPIESKEETAKALAINQIAREIAILCEQATGVDTNFHASNMEAAIVAENLVGDKPLPTKKQWTNLDIPTETPEEKEQNARYRACLTNPETIAPYSRGEIQSRISEILQTIK